MAPHELTGFGDGPFDSNPRRLELEGPILEVIIRREPGAQPAEGVREFLETRALIDTGASDNAIDYRIAHALQLRQIDEIGLKGVGGRFSAPVFQGVLEVPALQYKKLVRLIAPKVNHSTYSMLLGRTFLSNFIMTYDGPNNMFIFFDPSRGVLPPAADD